MFSRNLIALSLSALILSSVPAFAKMGTETSGGGDTQEMRVNDIRADILQWINKGGAKALSFSKPLSYHKYVQKMNSILISKKVVVAFTDKPILVKKSPKTCKNFKSLEDSKDHILCNIARFDQLQEEEQYKLIHHEYAGLAGVEKNEGAASDYVISSQMIGFLVEQVILKLEVRDASEVDFKKMARDQFIKEANDPTSELGMKIAAINIETTDERNQDGIIVVPIQKSDIQISKLEEEEIHNPMHSAELENHGESCNAEFKNISYLVLLPTATNIHSDSKYENIVFKVTIIGTIRYSRKDGQLIKRCDDALRDNYDMNYVDSPENYSIKISEIEINEKSEN